MATMQVLIFLACFSAMAYGYQDCTIDLDWSTFFGYTHEKVKDTIGNNVELLRIKRLDIFEVNVVEGKYIDAKIVNNEIVFSTSSHFMDMEKELRNSYEEKKLVSEIEFLCEEGETTTSFKLPVEDVNTHVPFFNRNVYTYKFGMDVPKGLVLTSLMEILATDIDILDDELIFETVGDDLTITAGYSVDEMEKTQRARLTVAKDITESKTIKIKVRDEREENKFGEADVKIIIVK